MAQILTLNGVAVTRMDMRAVLAIGTMWTLVPSIGSTATNTASLQVRDFACMTTFITTACMNASVNDWLCMPFIWHECKKTCCPCTMHDHHAAHTFTDDLCYHGTCISFVNACIVNVMNVTHSAMNVTMHTQGRFWRFGMMVKEWCSCSMRVANHTALWYGS